MERIHIVKKSVTKLDVDCVVNAANEGLWAGGGVCGAIFKEAGYNELTDACTKIGHCDTGNAVITPGFQLKAKYIIHAVGPQWHGGSHNKEHLLRKCYQTALLLARDNGCKSIGFPLISSGIYGYPKKEAWQVALRAVADSLDSFVDMEVYFAVLDDTMLAMGQEIYHAMFDYTGDNVGLDQDSWTFRQRNQKLILNSEVRSWNHLLQKDDNPATAFLKGSGCKTDQQKGNKVP